MTLNKILRFWVIVIIVLILGKYMIIGYVAEQRHVLPGVGVDARGLPSGQFRLDEVVHRSQNVLPHGGGNIQKYV